MSGEKKPVPFLDCPECDDWVLPAKHATCNTCELELAPLSCLENPEHDASPTWQDGDGDTCGTCGERVQVSCDGETPAYAVLVDAS